MRFGPGLIEHHRALTSTVVGDERLPMDVRIALHLRLARLLRCPVCLVAFPGIGRVAGLSGRQIDAALEGEMGELPPMMAQVVSWAEAVVRADGEMPLDWPHQARAMTMHERERVLMLTRLEILVHAIGLAVVPTSLLGTAPREAP